MITTLFYSTNMKKIILFFLIVFSIFNLMLAQEPMEQQRKNVIKLELTQAIFPNSLVFSYERITKPNQSFCITGGYEEFPDLISVSSTTRVKQDLIKSGYRAGGEYRFYLKKENKHLAPHGVYIGPYTSYHSFYNKREVEVDVDGVKETAELQTDFQILNIGFQLGYQFVINNRWTFDIVALGPAVSNYRAYLKMEGDFTFDADEVENEVFLKLLDRLPMLDDVLTNKELSTQGRFNSWSYGWRYQFHIGFQFGKKK